MSYRRTYSETISGVVRDSVSYPASENGGSISVALEWSEDVDIEILVDTDRFHGSVHSLRGHIDGFTASVVATEAAHIRQKAETAQRIAATLNDGFNQLIRSEISQQTAGLRSRVDSRLLELRDMGQSCIHIQQNMQADYARITERYAKVFEELDREMQRRVFSLDSGPLQVRDQVQERVTRISSDKLCGIATVTAAESARAQMMLAGAGARARAHSLLQSAAAYLGQELRMARGIQAMCAAKVEASESSQLFLPVLYMESDAAAGPARQAWMAAGPSRSLENLKAQACDLFSQPALAWRSMAPEKRRQLEERLLARLESVRDASPAAEARIRENIVRLWKAGAPQELSA